MNLTRRNFLRGSSLIIASPAIIRVAKLMPISVRAGDLWEFRCGEFTSLSQTEWRIINSRVFATTLLDWHGVFCA
jgi:hypothetical protein